MSNPDILKSIFTADCTLVVECDGTISWCDGGATDLLGLSAGLKPGWDFPRTAGLYGPDSSAHLRFEEFPLGRILTGEKIENAEVLVRSARTRHEGIWLSVSAEPVMSWRMDKVEAALVVCHDITGRKNALRGLEDAHAALEALVQASPLPVLAMEPDGRVSFWNPAAEKLFGWTAAEVLGGALPFVPPENAGESRRMRSEDLAGEVVLNRDIRRRRKDGTMLDLAVSRAPILDRRGRITGTICLYSDMTERRQIEERLSHSAKMESLGILAGGIAHDFNNLLTDILGNASLALEDAQPGSDQARALKDVMQAVDRASQLTNQMLAYAGQSNFRPELLDVTLLIETMSGVIRSTLGRDVRLRLELEDSLPLVRADAEQFRHVITHLVLNAREAIPGAGRVAIRTGVRTLPGEHEDVFIQVADDGCGMTRETQERMFDPFFSTKFTGRGLGLASVLGIVHRHGGTVSVDSTPGKGTSIWVYLPLSDTAFTHSARELEKTDRRN